MLRFMYFFFFLCILLMFAMAIPVVSFAQENETIEKNAGKGGSGLFGVDSVFNGSFFSIASLTEQQLRGGSGSIESYSYLSGSYLISPDKRFFIRVPFYANTTGYNKKRYEKRDNFKEGKVELGDVILIYSMYDLFYLGPVDFSGSVRLYLPTGEYSRDIVRTYARLRFYFYSEMFVGDFGSLKYVVKPDIYFQSRTAFSDPETPKRRDGTYRYSPIKGTKAFGLEHYLELEKELTRFISIAPSVGFDEDWYNGSEVEGISAEHVTKATLQLSLQIKPERGLFLVLGVQNKPWLLPDRDRRTGEKKSDVTFFAPRDNEVFVMLNAYLF